MKKIFQFAMPIILGIACLLPTEVEAKNKKILTVPDDAKIYVDGNYVADGTFFLKFGREDFFLVKVEAPGYVTKQMRVTKSDTRSSILFQLKQDDSIEGSVASELANRYFTIQVREGVTEELAWKLLSQVILNYFDEMKTSDRASGYMNTTGVITRFTEAEVKVRTSVQIKEITNDGLAYQIRINSEIGPLDGGDNSYMPWNRVLKKYEPLINEMQSRIGNN